MSCWCCIEPYMILKCCKINQWFFVRFVPRHSVSKQFICIGCIVLYQLSYVSQNFLNIVGELLNICFNLVHYCRFTMTANLITSLVFLSLDTPLCCIGLV